MRAREAGAVNLPAQFMVTGNFDYALLNAFRIDEMDLVPQLLVKRTAIQ